MGVALMQHHEMKMTRVRIDQQSSVAVASYFGQICRWVRNHNSGG